MTSGDVEPARLHLVGIEPDPHRILAGAEHVDVADAGQPRDLVLQPDGGVVAEIEAVVAPVGRRQRDDLQDRGRLLLHRDALLLHGLRQLRQRGRDAVLHQHLREVEIGADLEGDGERVGAVGGGIGLHVDHAFHAVDLLLDRQRDGVDHGARAGAGIARGHLHGRRHHVGILRDRQPEQRHRADHDHQDRQHVGEDRPLDEEFRDHGRRLLRRRRRRRRGRRLTRGSTFWPGTARMMPATTTRSSALMPFSITRISPSSGPISTLRCSTTLSLLTTSK